jgi:hypothetical protein
MSSRSDRKQDNIMKVFMGGVCAILLLAGQIAPAEAQNRDSANFDIFFRGIKAAQLGFTAIEENGRYSARSVLQASGLIGAVRKITYEASAQGSATGGDYVPSQYKEKRNNNGKIQTAEMKYRAGVPQGRELTPPRPARPGDLDPLQQGGTWDVMTAIFAVFRDKPRDQVCKVNQVLFDGRRRSQLSMRETSAAGNKITCAAEYRRLDGFSDKELADGNRFPFTMTYQSNGNGEWHVTRVDMNTIYGSGKIVRR